MFGEALGSKSGHKPVCLNGVHGTSGRGDARPQIFHEDADDFSLRYAEICLGTDCTIKVANAGFVWICMDLFCLILRSWSRYRVSHYERSTGFYYIL